MAPLRASGVKFRNGTAELTVFNRCPLGVVIAVVDVWAVAKRGRKQITPRRMREKLRFIK